MGSHGRTAPRGGGLRPEDSSASRQSVDFRETRAFGGPAFRRPPHAIPWRPTGVVPCHPMPAGGFRPSGPMAGPDCGQQSGGALCASCRFMMKILRQMACKPGSVPAPEGAMDGHSSGTSVAGRLVRHTRAAARKLACPHRPVGFPWGAGPAAPTQSCSRWGLPCPPCRQGGGALLPHPFTLARRPTSKGAADGRFAFCGTFPRVAPAGRYPAPCSRGARTFLPGRRSRRRGGHPAI